MSGPCSYPARDKREWEKLNEMVCDSHKNCWPHLPVGDERTKHVFVTLRVWLVKRNKLRTGKTK